MGITELTVTLWQERRVLEELLAATGQALAPPRDSAQGEAPRAASDLREELGLIRLARDVELAAVAQEWGLGPATGLAGLAAGAPTDSWRWVLDSHHQALTDLEVRLGAGRAAEAPDTTPPAGSPVQEEPPRPGGDGDGGPGSPGLPDSLLGHALNAVSEGSLITDAAQDIVYANAAFTAITGYTSEELLGKNCRILQGPGSDRVTLAAMSSRLQRGETFRGNILNYRKNGSPFWNALTVSPLRDDEGRITHFVSIQRDITAQVALQEELRFLALHDPLTGLPNRSGLEQRLGTAPAATDVALGVIRFDNFRHVSDTFGRHAGDALLREMAHRLKSNLRTTDFLARIGGDEFILLIAGVDDAEAQRQIGSVAARLHRAVETPVPLGGGNSVQVGMSMGLALHRAGRDGFDDSRRRAEAALSDRTVHGDRGRQWWSLAGPVDPSPHPGSGTSATVPGPGGSARRAGDPVPAPHGPAGTLSLVLQPVVDLRTGKVDLLEALARVSIDGHPPMGPADFLPALAAQEVDQLFQDALEQALSHLARWDRSGRVFRVSVNLSPSTLLDPGCTGWVASALERHGIAPDRLVLELLETGAITSPVQVAALWNLRTLGVCLAMDDLGSGYSSLQRLSVLPFSAVKIDGALTAQLRTRPVRTLTILAMLVQMGRDLDWDVIIEGLEDAALTEAARILAPPYGQGYFLAPPLEPADVPAWVEVFAPPGADGGLETFLGALAYTWQFTRLRSPHPGPQDRCPLTAFLDAHAEPGSPALHWHGLQHGPAEDAPEPGARLVDWLADRSIEEYARLPLN
ncbi:EAL domain-containing protein [Arthrobacter sp. MSA 4-2]|uniref:putative bifunctional diguanylate cyclase/phosphodiesterase n=1 Tax=Arthrobacter sp. MSA 4-2 TaxID=2794349 RepID=UPI0018E71172|nr:GGDEF domain-containing phosphodiesterase [Arthrobacter sp. MSA 4-2]MBJ2119529.1 EAL domain-containing protein [Arthrobacter sp. MSA 4-2]